MASHSHMSIDRNVVEQYHERGYFTVESLLAPEEVAAICAEVTRIVDSRDELPAELIQWERQVASGEYRPPTPEFGVRKLFRMAKHVELFRDLAFHLKLTEIATAILGPELLLMQSMLLMKPPNCSTDKVWHQDNAYFHLSPCDVFGIWIACDEATVENGCMHIVPGSHKRGLRQHAGGGDEYGCVQPPKPDDVLPVPLQPGDALIFHGELLHHTPANRTQRRRRAVQYHYATANCQRRPGEHPFELPTELVIARSE
jgi:phytanoyl-CoA hydroxylase